MTQEEIRERQKPLFEKYRRRPEEALITLSIKGILGENGTCRLAVGEFYKETGLHPASGGSGIHYWPGEMFLESVAASAGVTLNSIAANLGIELKKAEVIAEGDIDFRGSMGISNTSPVGFTGLRLRFNIDSDAEDYQLKNMITLTKKYCVVYQTLRTTPDIEMILVRNETVNA